MGKIEKFVFSGVAKKGLTDTYSKVLHVTVNGEKRTLRIALRKMNKGVNVYRIAQEGRFRGVASGTMPITAVLPGDDAIVEPVLAQDTAKMMARRGL